MKSFLVASILSALFAAPASANVCEGVNALIKSSKGKFEIIPDNDRMARTFFTFATPDTSDAPHIITYDFSIGAGEGLQLDGGKVEHLPYAGVHKSRVGDYCVITIPVNFEEGIAHKVSVENDRLKIERAPENPKGTRLVIEAPSILHPR